MSVSGKHLSQERLSEKAMEVLTELKDLLEAIEFKPERKNLMRCDNLPALFDIVQRLTKELQFITVKDPIPPYNAFRIPADESGAVEPPTIRVSTGPAYLIPVRVIKGTPIISNQPFEAGTATLIKSPVRVSPALDFLVIAPPL